MNNNSPMLRQSERPRQTLVDYDETQVTPSRRVSLRDACNLLLGALLGYIMIGW